MAILEDVFRNALKKSTVQMIILTYHNKGRRYGDMKESNVADEDLDLS
jgi:hypothetical protein